MWCSEPVPIYKKGVPPRLNPLTGVYEFPVRHCNRCRSCIAGRKNDWTGRLSAEAGDAESVYFLTMTYAEEPRDEDGKRFFRYKDVQRMLYLLRAHLSRRYGGEKNSLRYFVVGELGERKGRIHWHMLLFMRGKHMIPDAWNKDTNRRQLWEYWPHGWTEIARVNPDDTLRRIRYVAKYAVKSFGDDKTLLCRPRFSTVPMIGAAFAVRMGQERARQALPMVGSYTLAGHVFSKGEKKGQHIKYRLRGSAARRAAEAYVDAWTHEAPWYVTGFLHHYHLEEMYIRRQRWPEQRYPRLRNIVTDRDAELAAHERRKAAFDEWAEDVGADFRNPYISPNLHLPIPEWQVNLWARENGHVHEGKTKAEIAPLEDEQRAWNEIERVADRERDAKAFRRSQINRHFFVGYSSPVAETYIETGRIGDHTGPEAEKIDNFSIGEGHRYDPDAHKWQAEPYADKRRIIERAWFEIQRAIWESGEIAQEVIDPETGEVTLAGFPQRRSEPRPEKPQPIGVPFEPKGSRHYARALAYSDELRAVYGTKQR